GVDELRGYLARGQTVALVGTSGAGKSSLANALSGSEVMRVQTLARDGRGQHTTTHRQLIPMPGGGLMLDTPGLRELGLWGADAGLDEAFDDIVVLAPGCRFSDCAHGAEPGCAVREAVRSGALDGARVEHFRRLREEAARRSRPWQSARRPAPPTGAA
ncbi:MAG: ribosome small subunit-dependent GTPase A, partial [Deltaproteobacteria bacterium]|nr:ribosome small subunit-dependent GTPase A [Deltaproteobacteria bacterium]